MGVSECLFWDKQPPTTVDAVDEAIPKAVEKTGDFGVHLFRRHSHPELLCSRGEKRFVSGVAFSAAVRHGNKLGEICPPTSATNSAPGVSAGFSEGLHFGAKGNDEGSQEATGKTSGKQTDDL